MNLKVLGVILVTTFHISCALSSPLSETYVPHTRITTDQDDDDSYRLPQSVRPLNYVIKLIPNLHFTYNSSWPFDGTVDISVEVKENTNNITLHSNNIEIKNIDVFIGEDIIATNYTILEDDHQFLIIRKDDNSSFIQNQYLRINIDYRGYLEDDMHGFYRSYYYQNGTKRWLAITQFQPTHARRAFPCFDEPALKATFDITISVEEGFTAISNMPLKHNSSSAGRMEFQFEKTEPMSTYLVAFMVSEFDYVQSDVMDLRIWSRTDALNDTAFSVKESPKILKAMERFLNISYTLSKMDEVAVPDFSAGAMENWGLVTYRERLLLSNDDLTDSFSKQRIFTTIAHEFAHQWFGDLVSPDWWSYAWLNEGFATYFEYFITHKLKEKWRLDEQFVVRVVQTAFAADASESTHPMTHSVSSPDEVAGLFDTISYQKAGAVIRMLEHFLSTDVFHRGLKEYLNSRFLDDAIPEELFIALNDSYNAANISDTEVDPMEVMQQWSTQPGYPVVTVNSLVESNVIQLRQERFLLKKTEVSPMENITWTIPISYACVGDQASLDDTKPRIFMRESKHYISDFNTSGVCLFNVKQSGYFRVNYDANTWDQIIHLLLQGNVTHLLPALIRAQLLDDSFALARAEIINYDVPISISRYLENEKDFIPWYSALNSLSFLNTRFYGTENYPLFAEYILKLLNSVYNEVGFEKITEDDHVKKLLQNLVLTWMCKLEYEHCVENSIKMFRNLMDEVSTLPIPADLQSVVYCTTVRVGNASDWQFLWYRYVSSNVATERTLILSALGCSKNQENINELLHTAITDPNIIRLQDVESVFSAVYSSPGGVDLALEFVAKNYENIENHYKIFNGDIASLIHGIASRISTTKQLTKLKEVHEIIGNNSEIFIAAQKTAEENLQWTEKNQQKIMELIKNANEVTTLSPTTTTKGAGSISPALYLIVILSASYLFVYLQ